MKRLLIFCTLFTFGETFSQSFVQINQTPLLYHPSFAGAKGQGRLAWAGNVSTYNRNYTYYPKTRVNNYLSYDDLWKKKGIGWGASLHSQLLNGRSKNSLDGWANGYHYKGEVSISSKHVLFSSKDIKPRHTLSPSISVAYSTGHWHHEYSQRYGGPYSPNYFEQNQKMLQTTFGLMLNNQFGYLGLAYRASLAFGDEHRPIFHQVIEDGAVVQHSTPFYNRYTVFYSTFSFVFARTLFAKYSSFFSLTPSGYIAVQPSYDYRIKGTTSLFVGNLTATIWKIYVGAGYSSNLDSRPNVYAGYQNDRFRTGVTYGWDPDSDNLKNFWELSFSYFFKSSGK